MGMVVGTCGGNLRVPMIEILKKQDDIEAAAILVTGKSL